MSHERYKRRREENNRLWQLITARVKKGMRPLITPAISLLMSGACRNILFVLYQRNKGLFPAYRIFVEPTSRAGRRAIISAGPAMSAGRVIVVHEEPFY